MKKSKRIFILVFIGVLLMVSSFESREIRAEEITIYRYKIMCETELGEPISDAVISVSSNLDMSDSSDLVTDEYGVVLGETYEDVIYVKIKEIPGLSEYDYLKKIMFLEEESEIILSPIEENFGMINFEIRLKSNGKTVKEFEAIIVDEDNNILEELYTQNGLIETSKFDDGTYYVYYKFEEGIKEYIGVEEVEIEEKGVVLNGEIDVDIEVEIETKIIKIIKKDENGKSLSGMIFNLYDENGVFVESLITNTRGEAKSSKLPYGKYIIEEVYQEGFIPLESFEFVIDKDSVETINIVNKYANGQVSIRKIDSVSKGPIAKVKFGIYRQEDQMLMETITTNSQGLATSKKLDFGFYYLKEIDSPAIYEDNPNTYSFEISEASKNVEMQIENTKKEGEIVPPEGPKKLRIVKKDLETNEVLADVSFGIYNSKGELIETVKTDKNGIAITSKKLNNIVYTIKEEISPKGYYPIENIKVRLDEPSFVETKGNEKIYEQVIANKKTSFRITKTDDKGNILSGAKLRLVDSTGKEVVKDWISDQKPHELRGLEVGKKYILQELEAVDGYIKVDDQELIVKSDKENELYLVNETIKTKIIKLDEKTNQPLKDVVFNLETAEGEKLKFKKTKAIYTRDEEGQEELKTDKNGEIVLETLETGKFYLVEKSPNEYYENIGRVEIIVAEKDMVNPVIIRNDRINKFGKLIINKKDAYTYEPIKDVEIRILDEDKTELGIYATDDAGQISVELPYGKYFYQELKVDKRYRLDPREHEVSVDKEVVEKEFLNESTFLKIIKENKEKERLKGVKFNILDENDKVLLFTYEEDKDLYISDQYGEIEGLVTNEEGEIVVLRLDKGSYKIEEKESLPGYVMEEMPKEIALEDKQEVTIVNKKMSDIENVPGKKKDPPKKEDPKGPPPPPGGAGSQGSINTSQGKSQGMTTPKTGDKSILNYIVSLTISTFVLASTKRRSK